MFAGPVEFTIPLGHLVIGLVGIIVIFFVLILWPARIAAYKGHSFIDWFIRGLLLVPLWLGLMLWFEELGLLFLPVPLVIAECLNDRTAGIEDDLAAHPALDESVSND